MTVEDLIIELEKSTYFKTNMQHLKNFLNYIEELYIEEVEQQE